MHCSVPLREWGMSDTQLSILLLEADAMTRALYERELSRHFRVFTSRDREDALRVLGSNDIQAIILEPEWASEQGWQFLRTLSLDTKQSHIPVIICSVLDEQHTGRRLGVAAYCVKPVLPTMLLATLRQVLAPARKVVGEKEGRNL